MAREDDEPQRRGSERKKWGKPCPKCGSPYLRSGPWPWYLGTVGAMFCKAVVCTECGHEFDYNKPQADFKQRKLILAIVINAVGGIGIIAIIGLLVVWLMAMGR